MMPLSQSSVLKPLNVPFYNWWANIIQSSQHVLALDSEEEDPKNILEEEEEEEPRTLKIRNKPSFTYLPFCIKYFLYAC